MTGLFQALEYAGVEIYPLLAPVIRSHYHSVTMHGVLNVLVFTTFFICGFVPFIFSRSLQGAAGERPARLGDLLGHGGGPRAGGDSAGRQRGDGHVHVLSAAQGALGLLRRADARRRGHLAGHLEPRAHMAWVEGAESGRRTPLAAFMSLVTFAMWTLASVGLAAEMLLLLIPWSLGLVGGTDALLARTLFWFTGHPIVYFWLLPAYISWYTLVPRQAGGKLFSDPMARTSFILFLILSTPIGIHHQYADPGIHQGWKLLHALLTFAVFFPSLLTFFNVTASLETAGRRAAAGDGSAGSRSFRGPIHRWPRRCSPWCSSPSAGSAV